MRILVCGDRDWTDYDMVRDALAEYKKLFGVHLSVCHGAARGADRQASIACAALSIECTPFPADWHSFGRAAGPIRNRQMLREFRPELVLAFHDDLEHSKGTKDMKKIAEASEIRVIVYHH